MAMAKKAEQQDELFAVFAAGHPFYRGLDGVRASTGSIGTPRRCARASTTR